MDWRYEAACLDEDPELFFPIGNTGPAIPQIAKATAICAGCPVSQECLRWALDTGQDAGIWGGLPEDERRALKRRNARQRNASFSTPRAPREREPQGGFVAAEPVRVILAEASERRWMVMDLADATGLHQQSIASILKSRTSSVTELTARKVTEADLSGPPPVPADAPTTAVRC